MMTDDISPAPIQPSFNREGNPERHLAPALKRLRPASSPSSAEEERNEANKEGEEDHKLDVMA